MFRSLGGVMCKFWGFSLSLHTCIQGNVCPGSYQWVIFEQFHCYRKIFNLLHGSIPILHGGQKWNDNGTESICFLTWNPVCDAAVCYLTRIWLDINFPPNLPQHSVSYMCGWLLAEHFLHSPGLCSTLTRFSYISLYVSQFEPESEGSADTQAAITIYVGAELMCDWWQRQSFKYLANCYIHLHCEQRIFRFK